LLAADAEPKSLRTQRAWFPGMPASPKASAEVRKAALQRSLAVLMTWCSGQPLNIHPNIHRTEIG
jgi:hypothetical protein